MSQTKPQNYCNASSASSSAPNRIRINIKDTGAGLSSEKILQLFQPFNRLGQEMGTEEGTGIGLVMSKRVVELMGGVIGVTSVVGVGSIFWFEISLAEAPVLLASATTSLDPLEMYKQQQQQNRNNNAPLRTVLYVEDNPANQQLIAQLIERRSDVCLKTAMNGNSGVELALSTRPDVILMDINLPDINGFQALKILRANPSTALIPVIAVSANAMRQNIDNGLEAGFFRYITKPIKINEMMEALDAALALAASIRPSK